MTYKNHYIAIPRLDRPPHGTIVPVWTCRARAPWPGLSYGCRSKSHSRRAKRETSLRAKRTFQSKYRVDGNNSLSKRTVFTMICTRKHRIGGKNDKYKGAMVKKKTRLHVGNSYTYFDRIRHDGKRGRIRSVVRPAENLWHVRGNKHTTTFKKNYMCGEGDFVFSKILVEKNNAFW